MADKNAAIDVLKGILMLAVMLGHNKLLMSATGLFSVLYTFHIPGFFFVAALLNRKALTTAKAIDKSFIYLYPHFIFFSAISLVYLSLGFSNISPSLSGWLYAFISGNGTMAKEYSGFQLLWYLPAIFSFYLVVGFYNGQDNRLIKIALLSTSLIGTLLLYGNEFPMKYLPFGLGAVAFIFPVAIAVRWVIDRYGRTTWLYVISLIVAVALFPEAMYFPFNLAISTFYSPGHPIELVSELLFMSAVFFLLLKASTLLSGNKLLGFIGKHTLEIFLTHHLFDVLLFKWISEHYSLPDTTITDLLSGTAMFTLVLALSLLVACAADKSKLSALFHPPQVFIHLTGAKKS